VRPSAPVEHIGTHITTFLDARTVWDVPYKMHIICLSGYF